MDIDALVARITDEVMNELSRKGNGPAPAPRAQEQHSCCHHGNSGGASFCGGCGVCTAKTTGECSGKGSCASLVPEKVQAVVDAGAERVSSGLGTKITGRMVADMIDHTLLKADAKRDDILKLCEEARENRFASVCVNPAWVSTAADALRGCSVKVCTVIGFPLGATTSFAKANETRDAIANGADEIDMVINIGALKNNQDDLVANDIREVINAAGGRLVKVIIEAAMLSDEEVVRACRLSRDAGADFVKTSTGFGPGGATAHHVALMRRTVGRNMGVKASGGIRDYETAAQMIEAGATRIGASASIKIMKGGN